MYLYSVSNERKASASTNTRAAILPSKFTPLSLWYQYFAATKSGGYVSFQEELQISPKTYKSLSEIWVQKKNLHQITIFFYSSLTMPSSFTAPVFLSAREAKLGSASSRGGSRTTKLCSLQFFDNLFSASQVTRWLKTMHQGLVPLVQWSGLKGEAPPTPTELIRATVNNWASFLWLRTCPSPLWTSVQHPPQLSNQPRPLLRKRFLLFLPEQKALCLRWANPEPESLAITQPPSAAQAHSRVAICGTGLKMASCSLRRM